MTIRDDEQSDDRRNKRRRRFNDNADTGRSDKESVQPDTGESGDSDRLSSAINQLEESVRELAAAGQEQTIRRATAILNKSRRRTGPADFSKSQEDDRSKGSRRSRHRRYRSNARLARKRHRETRQAYPEALYLDPRDARIAGVCAGFARYFNVETWMVRLAALGGLLFIPSVVFPAYWVAYFVMDKIDRRGAYKSGWLTRRRERQERRLQRDQFATAEEINATDSGNSGYTESAADSEWTSRSDSVEMRLASASSQLRYCRRQIADAEKKLRDMESYVTSNRFELDNELAKI